MNRVTSLIYHTVHTNGWLADTVYRAAYPFNQLFRRLRNRKAKADAVTPEELYEFRHLGASGFMVIGVTNVCNARCVFCAYPRAADSKDLKGGVMPLPLFKKIVDEWVTLGGENIDLTHTVGDPLVDPGLVDKINYAVHEAGIKFVSFTTNGILLNRNDTYRRVIDAGVSAIYISTEGTNKEMYEKVYGVKHYDDMLSGVHNLLEYNRSKGEPTSIAIRFRNAQKPSEIIRSRDFIQSIKPYFSTKVRCNFTVEFDNWGGMIKDQDVFGNMKLRNNQERVDVPCRALFGFMVRYDGSVRLCGCRFNRSDMDDMVVGNMREQSLIEISKNSKTWDIIKDFYSGKRPDTCHGCSLYHPINRMWFGERQRLSKANLQNQAAHAAKARTQTVAAPAATTGLAAKVS
jgi:MoaA/NifB/PqqE/SkfB family radical SAM enzyme